LYFYNKSNIGQWYMPRNNEHKYGRSALYLAADAKTQVINGVFVKAFELLTGHDNGAHSCHVFNVHALDLLCLRGAAVLKDDHIVIKRVGVVAGGPDAVGGGRAHKDNGPYLQAAEDQVEPGAEKGTPAGLDYNVIVLFRLQLGWELVAAFTDAAGLHGPAAADPRGVAGGLYIAAIGAILALYEKDGDALAAGGGNGFLAGGDRPAGVDDAVRGAAVYKAVLHVDDY